MSTPLPDYFTSIIRGFFSSGMIRSISILRIPSFISAPFTTTSSEIVKAFLKARLEIPLCRNSLSSSPSGLDFDSIKRVFSFVSSLCSASCSFFSSWAALILSLSSLVSAFSLLSPPSAFSSKLSSATSLTLSTTTSSSSSSETSSVTVPSSTSDPHSSQTQDFFSRCFILFRKTSCFYIKKKHFKVSLI